MARTLFPGCDVWLNNPLRPLEACGTSGMKAAINGSLNLSVLDGWWDEMYDGENGWAIPTANNGASAEERDDIEAVRTVRTAGNPGGAALLRHHRCPRRRSCRTVGVQPRDRAHPLGVHDQAHPGQPRPRRFR